MPDVAPDGKAEAADDDKGHNRKIHDRIRRIAAEAAARVHIRQHVEARVAERGDGMEHAVPQRPAEAELRQEAEKQDQRAHALDRGRAAQDVAHEAHDAAVGVAAQRLGQHHALPQADPAPQREEKQAGDGHEAETADLDEQQDHHLAEHRPVRTGIDADEARDAGRGGRGEQARQKRRRPAGPCRGGQTQQPRPKEDDPEKHQHDQLARPDPAEKHSKHSRRPSLLMKLYYIIVSSRTAVKENRFSGLFLPEKHDKLIKKRETRTSRMRISRLLVCLCLLALLCACAAPAAALPETPAEATAAPEPVPTEPPVPAESVKDPVAAEEPEPEYALLPAEPVWLLGQLTELFSAAEAEWAAADDVLTAAAPLQADADVLAGLDTIRAQDQDYVNIKDAAAALGLEWGLAPDGSRYLAKRQTVGEIPEGWNVPVLMYHAVGDEIWGYSDLFVSAASMEEQLQYLQENGYEAIWFSDLAHIEDYEKPVILTFDDGYDDNYTVLYPLLEKYQTKATIFVIGNAMGSTHKMTQEQVYEMAASGLVSIQSHTYTHGNLSAMDEAALRQEMERSNAALAAATGQIPYVLCYPEGKYSYLTMDVAKDYYTFALRMDGWTYQTGMDPYQVPRSFVSRRITLPDFLWFIDPSGKTN